MTLHFRLAAINNQNFVMRDVETGTWWQQVTGEALQGPLAGDRLARMPFEELSFELWQTENPQTLVMLPELEHADGYVGADWEAQVGALPVPDALVPAGDLAPRDLVVGVQVAGQAVAYPLNTLRDQTPIADQVGEVPLLVACAADGRSVRVFDRRVQGQVLDLYARPDSEPPVFVDVQTGSEWTFAGSAIDGPLMGTDLPRIAAITDAWFDWENHNPDTRVYTGGRLQGAR